MSYIFDNTLVGMKGYFGQNVTKNNVDPIQNLRDAILKLKSK